jgi:hypothetical protein
MASRLWYSNTASFEVKLMSCKSCTSENQKKVRSEMIVHFSGLKNLDAPPIFASPELLVCMDCGFTELDLPKTTLCQLAKGFSSGTKSSQTYLSFLRSSSAN